MKKLLCTCGFVLLLLGCQAQGGEAEEKISGSHAKIETELEYRVPVKWEVILVDERKGESIYVLLNDFGYNPQDRQLNEDSLNSFARNLASGIDQPMRNPTVNEDGELVEGQNEIVLSESELVETLLDLSFSENEVVLPIYETLPTVAVEDLDGITEVVIGEFTTYFNSGVRGRSENIRLSSEAFQHHVLGPGDEFSFNRVVGQRTRERGYQEAKEIVNKQFVMGVGGGICQTSSTLFNAIDKAGLEVVERYAHSRNIGYVPPNRDATVSWGGPDFVFKNPYEFPILLRTDVSLERGQIDVKVYAAKEKEELYVRN
ncbi:VanW family protein [Bacillus sp. FJAT-45350]|uniref:VanW family protein n=1 Tax=Bacillus sp. FJAT-45350 TaxID=2011014 RepID=UPI000BB6F0EF|nr:VanW family protein [Bacillus sp. FJAT-45350]